MVLTTVIAWKFYWDIMDYLFYTKNNAFNLFIIGHFLTFIFAVIFNITGSLVGPGTSFFDGEVKETKSYFEIDFVSTLFKVINKIIFLI